MKGNQITSANHWRHVCQELFTDGRNGWKQDTSEALFNDTQVADVTAAAGREGGLFILLWSVTLLWQAVCEDKYRITDLIQKKCQKQLCTTSKFQMKIFIYWHFGSVSNGCSKAVVLDLMIQILHWTSSDNLKQNQNCFCKKCKQKFTLLYLFSKCLLLIFIIHLFILVLKNNNLL